ncbi:PH domain-containing protein [Brevibacterium album]|uniref:PH domain-containing protein n=1 Tax=Brevibacterium album TaxID=417948 RepID=UPI000403093C
MNSPHPDSLPEAQHSAGPAAAGSAPREHGSSPGGHSTGLNPVSPAYARVKLLGSGIGSGLVVLAAAGAGVAGLVFDLTWLVWLGFALAVLFLLSFAVEAVITVRQVRAIGYRERESDLLIQRGILFRSTTVVPYGRLQFVEVSAGPLLRMAGLASLELHTASASTDASLPGLPRAEAEALRDSLAARGGSKLAGL